MSASNTTSVGQTGTESAVPARTAPGTSTPAADTSAAWGPRTVDVARVTIELLSPLTIGAGAADDIVDSLFVLDANGLPALPGASLAGVIRERWRATTEGGPVAGQAETDVFGTAMVGRDREESAGARSGGGDGLESSAAGGADGDSAAASARPRIRSRLVVSWGAIHDAGNRPMTGRVAPGILVDDPVLRHARDPVVRQHVRLDARGAADSTGRGLFDESVVVRGHRFTFEIVAEDLPTEVMDRVLAILADPATRLGGRTRRGMGRFEVVGGTVRRRRFDLMDDEDFAAFAKLPVDLGAAVPDGVLAVVGVDAPTAADVVVARLSVAPRGFWMMGGGSPAPGAAEEGADDGAVDLLPYREAAVRWKGDRGTFDPTDRDVVLPATGIKGALRHRVGFHVRAAMGLFADAPDDAARQAAEERVATLLHDLFGHVDTRSGTAGDARLSAGRVIIDDVVLPAAPPSTVVNHVSLDRFTSGPLDGHLFAETPLWKLAADGGTGDGTAGGQGRVLVRVLVRGAAEVAPEARRALVAALDDLAAGRLQIGAGSGRGHGWFEGRVAWEAEGWQSGDALADAAGAGGAA